MVLGLGVEGGVSSTGARVVVWRVVGAGVGLGSVRAVLGGQGLRNGRLGPQGRGRCQVAWRSKGGAAAAPATNAVIIEVVNFIIGVCRLSFYLFICERAFCSSRRFSRCLWNERMVKLASRDAPCMKALNQRY